jgi:uncharacterized protein YceH (UPF0502 family)
MTTEAAAVPSAAKAAWQPLTALERRVLGVLIEKAKTTPDAYPLSLNAIRVGCNQKSNRSPVMELAEDAVQDAVDSLREKGVVIEVQGGGRVAKYRHLGYEWLGIDKREIAIMTELLLRGAQTVGELRGHAARMEAIPDLAALQPLLDGLIKKGLVTPLTPEGRGQVVAHALYSPSELQRLRADQAGRAPTSDAESDAPRAQPVGMRPVSTAPSQSSGAAPAAQGRGTPMASPRAASDAAKIADLAALRHEMTEAKSQIAAIRDELQSLRESLGRDIAELQRFRQEVGG